MRVCKWDRCCWLDVGDVWGVVNWDEIWNIDVRNGWWISGGKWGICWSYVLIFFVGSCCWVGNFGCCVVCGVFVGFDDGGVWFCWWGCCCCCVFCVFVCGVMNLWFIGFLFVGGWCCGFVFVCVDWFFWWVCWIVCLV